MTILAKLNTFISNIIKDPDNLENGHLRKENRTIWFNSKPNKNPKK